MTRHQTPARLLLLLGLVTTLVVAAPSAAQVPGDAVVSLTVRPRWGTATPGEWTVYAVTVTNRGATTVDGRVRLVPELEGNAEPAANADPSPSPERFPTHEGDVTVTAGAEKTLTFLVVEPPFGYGAQMEDDSRTTVARAARQAASIGGVGVALLTDVATDADQLPNLPEGPNAPVVTRVSAQDFPSQVLGLSGLRSVVIAGLDTAQLSPPQRDALRDFVGFGGTRVLTGGRAGVANLRALPEDLPPLRATDTATVGMAPVADLAGQVSDASAVVATGELRRGRSVVDAREGLPLVVEGDYGAGSVVQLTYDPLAEPFTSAPLQAAGWGPALGPALDAQNPGDDAPPGAAEAELLTWARLWSGESNRSTWLRWPPLLVALLFTYTVAVGALALMVVRRRRRVRAWAGVPLLALGFALATTVFSRASATRLPSTVMEIDTVSGSGTVVTEAYQRLPPVADDTTVLPQASAASTVYTNRFPFAPGLRTPALTSGTGGGSITESGGAGLELWSPSSATLTVQTLASDRDLPGLAATLQVTHPGDPAGARLGRGWARVTGQVTNRGPEDITQLQAHFDDGTRVNVAEVVAPGQSITVDAPLLEANTATAAEENDDHALSLVGRRAVTPPGTIALVGRVQTSPDAESTTLRILVQTVESGDTVAALPTLSSGPRVVSAVPPDDEGPWIRVLDLSIPPVGSQPLSVVYASEDVVEVHDWETGSWRRIRSGSGTDDRISHSERRAVSGEGDRGIVRVRVVEGRRPGAPSGSQPSRVGLSTNS